MGRDANTNDWSPTMTESTYDERHDTPLARSDVRNSNGRSPWGWLLALAAVIGLVVAGFFLFGGDVDSDVKGGNIDIEAPNSDLDIDPPDVDVEVTPGDAEADATEEE
jgi:hypothetical protein